MRANSSDTRIGDALIRQLPPPLAIAWARVLATGANVQHRGEQLKRAIDTLLRFLIVVSLPDYLRGNPDPAAEACFPKLARPSEGAYEEALRHIVRALRRRSGELAPFVAELPDWLLGREGEQANPPAHVDLQWLVTQRNKREHGPSELRPWADLLEARLRSVLQTLHWLTAYRLVRVARQDTDDSGAVGDLLVFSSDRREPEVHQRVRLRPSLATKSVYLLSPNASAVLNLSPFIAQSESGHVEEYESEFFLLREAPEMKGIVLDHGTSSGFKEGPPSSVIFHQWLDERGKRRPVVELEELEPREPLVARSSMPAGLLNSRYLDHGEIGSGGMAVVHRVFDRRLGRELALKVLRPDLRADALLARRFEREGQITAGLNHPLLLRVYDIGGDHSIRMEYAPGGSLRDRMHRGEIDEPQIRQWAEQLLDVLAFIHEKGVVHRDLKPENVLFAGDGTLRLADFGIASDERRPPLTETDQRLGTREYMAPEAIKGVRVDGRADVYSLAVVLDECLMGRTGVVPGKSIRTPFGELLRHMGAQDPEQRPTAAQALADLRRQGSAGTRLAGPAMDDPLPVLLERARRRRASGEASADENRDLEAAELLLQQGNRVVVALVGESQVGKTTIVNALAGRRLLPMAGLGPLTARATLVQRGTQAAVRTTYTSIDELTTALGAASPSEGARPAGILQVIQGALTREFGHSLDNGLLLDLLRGQVPVSTGALARPVMERLAELTRLLGASERLIYPSPNEVFQDVIRERVCGWRAPVVRTVEVDLPGDGWPGDLVLVDLPGIGTVDDPAAEATAAFLRGNCDIIAFVVRNNGFSEALVDFAERVGIASTLVGQPAGARAISVVTHLDDLVRTRLGERHTPRRSAEELFLDVVRQSRHHVQKQYAEKIVGRWCQTGGAPDVPELRVFGVAAHDALFLADGLEELALIRRPEATGVSELRAALAELAGRVREERAERSRDLTRRLSRPVEPDPGAAAALGPGESNHDRNR